MHYCTSVLLSLAYALTKQLCFAFHHHPQTITFPCNKWLASQDPKTHPRVELSPGTGDGLRRYIIKVKTSDQRGAGTDAGVSIEMFGEEGARLGPFPLDRQGAFERGQVRMVGECWLNR